MMSLKLFENDCGLSEFGQRDRENSRKTLFRIANVEVEIRSWHLPKTNYKFTARSSCWVSSAWAYPEPDESSTRYIYISVFKILSFPHHIYVAKYLSFHVVWPKPTSSFVLHVVTISASFTWSHWWRTYIIHFLLLFPLFWVQLFFLDSKLQDYRRLN